MILHLLLLQIATFVILLLVLRKLFYKQLNLALIRLQASHDANLQREQELKILGEEAKAEREELLKKAAEESERVVKEAAAAAEKIIADVELHARERAAKIVERTQAEIDRKARDLAAYQHQQAVDLAVRIVTLAFSSNGQEILHDHFLEEQIAEIKNLGSDTFTFSGNDRVVVTTAHLVCEVRKADLARVLSEKTGLSVTIDFEQDPQIVAGLVIKIGSLTLDGSLRNKLEKATLHLKK